MSIYKFPYHISEVAIAESVVKAPILAIELRRFGVNLSHCSSGPGVFRTLQFLYRQILL
jgi:hypothetical protein